jgi:hypothetical protein
MYRESIVYRRIVGAELDPNGTEEIASQEADSLPNDQDLREHQPHPYNSSEQGK